MATYTCKRCGKQFDLIGFSKYCKECRDYYTPCVICGTPVHQTNPENETKTCSRKCAGLYRKQSGISKAVAEKSIATKNKKYGNGSGAKYKPRKCKLCGKEFIPNGSKQVYCKNPHYGPCPVCGKQTLIRELSKGPNACSEECRIALITKLARERDNTESLKKNRQTCLERYGVEYYSQTKGWRDKVAETSMEHYGTTCPLTSSEIHEQVVKTNLEKYGYANPAQAPEIIEKISKTLEERHGGCGMASATTREKIYATNKERYGDIHPARTLQCKEKGKQTSLARYGYESYASTKESIARSMLDPSKIDDFWSFRTDPETYVTSHYKVKPYADELAADLGVNETSVYDILINFNCKDVINRSKTSIIEREMYEFLTTLVPESEIRKCDKRTITPLELDFYLPNYNFAVECNPTYTHNSSFKAFGEGEPKSTVYHRNKTDKADEAGIFLMHVFGYDWIYKQDIIKSMIRNALGKCDTTIYARNTEVKELDAKTTREFLNTNHRQGDVSSPIRLGLIDKQTKELVSVMTFSKPRTTIGSSADDPEGSYELVRFCSLLNTSVVGGASKLFKWFSSNYNPTKIISFSDRAHTRGNLYSSLGFHEVRRSDPGYAWVNVLTEDYKSRVACQKHKLPQLFDDVTEEDMNNKSERIIMMEHNYAQVYDSGTIRWEYTPG